MHIRYLSLTNFRNYARLELALPERPLLLHGANAQGKTSLLEAIYLLSTGSSPLTPLDRQLISWKAEAEGLPYARVQVGDRPLDAYGIWLGLEPEERARQLEHALDIIGDASPAVFGGDFNSTPDSPIYARIRAAGFDDPFIVGSFDPTLTSPAIEPAERIDFAWARGLEVRDAQVLDSLASDHRCVVVEIALP